MNRLTRVTSILIQLQSKKLVIAKEIADHFEVSLRTIYRDIKLLQDAGVPIGSTNSKGYFIIEGYHLPPIMISEEEANALVVAEKFIHNQGDTSLEKVFDSLLHKIKAVLRSTQKENYSKLQKRISPSSLRKKPISNSLLPIQNAILANGLVEIAYHAFSTNQHTIRIIEPLGLYFSSTNWILIAFCRKRKEMREFRLDRIEKLKVLAQKNENQRNFSLSEYFSKKYDAKLT